MTGMRFDLLEERLGYRRQFSLPQSGDHQRGEICQWHLPNLHG
jgi:hypothetical protein